MCTESQVAQRPFQEWTGHCSVLNNLRAGLLELCASCFRYLEMGQLLPPSTSQHIGRVSCELPGVGRQSILEPLAKLRDTPILPQVKHL